MSCKRVALLHERLFPSWFIKQTRSNSTYGKLKAGNTVSVMRSASLFASSSDNGISYIRPLSISLCHIICLYCCDLFCIHMHIWNMAWWRWLFTQSSLEIFGMLSDFPVSQAQIRLKWEVIQRWTPIYCKPRKTTQRNNIRCNAMGNTRNTFLGLKIFWFMKMEPFASRILRHLHFISSFLDDIIGIS